MRQFELLADRRAFELKRADRRAGGIIAALYNIHTRSSEADPMQDWQDFFTEWKEPITEQTEEQMFESMMMWTKVQPPSS